MLKNHRDRKEFIFEDRAHEEEKKVLIKIKFCFNRSFYIIESHIITEHKKNTLTTHLHTNFNSLYGSFIFFIFKLNFFFRFSWRKNSTEWFFSKSVCVFLTIYYFFISFKSYPHRLKIRRGTENFEKNIQNFVQIFHVKSHFSQNSNKIRFMISGDITLWRGIQFKIKIN